MITLTPERKGELYILSGALLWALFPVITILTFGGVTPLFSAAASMLIATGFFAVILTAKRHWGFLRERRAWKGIALNALFVGVLYFGLVFISLSHTTAGNEAIIAQMEVFFSFLILHLLLRHEPLVPRNVMGGACMVLGVSFILFPKASGWQGGNFLVILATMFAPIGNKYAQEVRRTVSSEYILFWRSLLSGLVLLLLAFLMEPAPSSVQMWRSWGFLAANGIIFLGLDGMLWTEGIHRIPITKAISLNSIAPLFTLIAAYFILSEPVTPSQIAGFVPIAVGIFLLTRRPHSVTNSNM
ncbi:MAG: DMT family transporter [Candidatus Peribacteraceae bacterium]|nr:DMT family transporter [Candidatus Peribacteraceae bacterium]